MALAAENPDQAGDAPLPLLRPDLEIVAGPPGADGGPTYTIYDPVPRRFSKVRWAEAQILERLRKPATMHSLKADLERTTTIRASDEEVEALVKKAVAAGLTTSTLSLPVDHLLAQAAARKAGPVKWALKHYLYIRIPLIRPDAFLEKTLAFARLFTSKIALALYAVFGFMGFMLLLQNLPAYLSTFSYFFNPLGMFWYAASIIALKIVHEFSHAYTAKAAGVRVPVMGVAFIVMWPVAFCDVTDAWRIKSRWSRFRIAAAGMASEFVIAGLALFGWHVTGPGLLNSICFVISSVSLASTLLVNLNPAMSFDGYYLLMDIWGVDNLRSRAFRAARWLYQTKLLGLDLPRPERGLTKRRLAAFAAYSAYSWLYRFFLYLGIAVLVYYKFTKTLGIVLFSVEIWWFILMPLVTEFSSLAKRRSQIRFSPTLAAALVIFIAAFAWVALPMKRTMSIPAVTIPESLQVVYAPASGVVERLYVKEGEAVSAGSPLADLVSVELDARIREVEESLDILKIERGNLQLFETDRRFLPQKLDEIAQAKAKLEGLRKERRRLSIKAKVAGKVVWWDDTLRVGLTVSRDSVLGRVADPANYTIRAFVAEDSVADISIGDPAAFRPSSDAPKVDVRIVRISPARMEHMEHVALTSLAQGVIPVVPDRSGRMRMLDTYYAVDIAPTGETTGQVLGESGVVRLTTKPRSLLASWLRSVYRVVLRESGF